MTSSFETQKNLNKKNSITIKKVLNYFKKSDPILYQKSLSVTSLSVLKPSSNRFSDLCGTIINQQLSTKAADSIFKRFKILFPKKKITAEYLLMLTDEKIRSVGISSNKVKYLKNLAQKVINKELILENIHKLKIEDVVSELTKIKGIGLWTAEMFLMFSLAQENIFSIGDLGLRKAVRKLYRLNSDPTQLQLKKISKRWSPYKTYACLILWKSLEFK